VVGAGVAAEKSLFTGSEEANQADSWPATAPEDALSGKNVVEAITLISLPQRPPEGDIRLRGELCPLLAPRARALPACKQNSPAQNTLGFSPKLPNHSRSTSQRPQKFLKRPPGGTPSPSFGAILLRLSSSLCLRSPLVGYLLLARLRRGELRELGLHRREGHRRRLSQCATAPRKQ